MLKTLLKMCKTHSDVQKHPTSLFSPTASGNGGCRASRRKCDRPQRFSGKTGHINQKASRRSNCGRQNHLFSLMISRKQKAGNLQQLQIR